MVGGSYLMIIIEILFNFIIATLLCAVAHEGGHYLVAKCFGKTINFKLDITKLFGWIPVPRGVWYMPEDLSRNKQKVVALSGFGMELIVSSLLWFAGWYYAYIVWFFHIGLYPFYAGEANDFKFLV